jgi:alpha-L-arabinofuranosidase
MITSSMKSNILPFFKALLISLIATQPLAADEPDSAFLFSYASPKNNGQNGLHFAYSLDGKDWKSMGNEYSFLRCDYGQWGAEKRMLDPWLMQDDQGLWHCFWSLNERVNAFAHAASADLVNWKPQSYPTVSNGTYHRLSVEKGPKENTWILAWKNASDNNFYRSETRDFKIWSIPEEILPTERVDDRVQVTLPSGTMSGRIHRVSWSQVNLLLQEINRKAYWSAIESERAADDPIRFITLKPVEATLTVNSEMAKPISNLLTGIFFEDINYSADGGLYAELVQNRDFEYNLDDRSGRDPNWNSKYAWTVKGAGTLEIETLSPIHPNNAHHAVVKVVQSEVKLVNEGFDGIVLKKGEKYDLSIFSRKLTGEGKKFILRLTGDKGETLTEGTLGFTDNWKKQQLELIPNADASAGKLEIILDVPGKYAYDMVSLFPQNTFKGRKNGLRQDLAQTLADMKPRFVRFPGGCVAHGDGLGNIYRWKTTVGPLEARMPMRNIWNYHQTTGLGYFEYFQFCEDIGAEALPVLAAGVPCQNSGTGGDGQQGGIPLCDMDEYVQDILDLIEWANGDAKTTKWGKIRAQAGHPKPFHLKYVGIGNEDLISDIFKERFTLIFNAIKEIRPEITVVGTVGPFYEGSDYEEGWKLATELKVPMVDEHYYVSPGWMIYHQDYYDNYDRNKSKVYLGEYAAHLPGRPNNLETALAEALYLTSVERNGDIVSMASYAPLLAKERHTQWNPDLIYFNNKEVKPTTDYQVQKLYGENAGDRYLSNNLSVTTGDDKVRKRVGTSVVRDSKSGDLVVKLVNMLPVTVRTQVQLHGTSDLQPMALRTVLTGKPDDRDLKPVTDLLEIGAEFPCELPAYSFTILRLKEQTKPSKK